MAAKSSLPNFIIEKMTARRLNPTLQELAKVSETPISTLGRNLSGQQEMRVSTAYNIARLLDTTVEELLAGCGLV